MEFPMKTKIISACMLLPLIAAEVNPCTIISGMDKKDGWAGDFVLPAGDVYYSFLVDGKMISDPANPIWKFIHLKQAA
jgi:hypothetical protein